MRKINSEIEAYEESRKVDFLTKEERLNYAAVLLSAANWGRKKDKENKVYFSKNHLINKYNV